MSSTSPELGTGASPVAGNDDSATRHLEGVSGGAVSFEAESAEAKQAKAEALAHARAAREARAKYARLVSQQDGVPSSNPGNKMPADSVSDMVASQSNSIVGTETAFIVSRIVDHAHSALEGQERDPLTTLRAGLTAYAPLLFLRPAKRRHGFWGFVSDPRVWPAALTVLPALGKSIADAQSKPADTTKKADKTEKG